MKLGARKAGMPVGTQAEKFRMIGLRSSHHKHNKGHSASTFVSPQINTICNSASSTNIFYARFISVGSNDVRSRTGSSDTSARQYKEVTGRLHAAAASFPGPNRRYPLYRMSGEPHSRSERTGDSGIKIREICSIV